MNLNIYMNDICYRKNGLTIPQALTLAMTIGVKIKSSLKNIYIYENYRYYLYLSNEEITSDYKISSIEINGLWEIVE